MLRHSIVKTAVSNHSMTETPGSGFIIYTVICNTLLTPFYLSYGRNGWVREGCLLEGSVGKREQ